jgi:hypothetical protein
VVMQMSRECVTDIKREGWMDGWIPPFPS